MGTRQHKFTSVTRKESPFMETLRKKDLSESNVVAIKKQETYHY